MKLLPLSLAALLAASAAFAGGMLKPGETFPTWELQDQAGKRVSSADLKGKPYLLYFYPKAMTPGCTTEGCTLRDNFAAFKQDGVEILGVSFDSPEKNAEFKAKYKFPFDLLSDTDHKLAVEVGAADSPSRLWARRISYLVGADGKIIRAYGDVSPAKHAAEVLADIKAAGLAAK
ncbi:MAG: peroxiredoxin [Acidobacteriota bacterium]